MDFEIKTLILRILLYTIGSVRVVHWVSHFQSLMQMIYGYTYKAILHIAMLTAQKIICSLCCFILKLHIITYRDGSIKS